MSKNCFLRDGNHIICGFDIFLAEKSPKKHKKRLADSKKIRRRHHF